MIDEIDNITIEFISAKLKNLVSPLDIIRWLNNFEKNELEYAIAIASNIAIYTNYEIEEVLNLCFTNLYPKIDSNELLVITPIGKFGKSGSLIAYFFQKTVFYSKNKSNIKLIPEIEEKDIEKDKIYKLALIDDFVGTGKSVTTYYEKCIKGIEYYFEEINFISVAGMKNGIKLIKPIFNKIEIPTSNIFDKVFSSNESYFGYRKYKEYREFAYKYGEKLTSPVIKKNGSKKYDHALGYENTQALVSFSYGSPNNTLPIIWSSKNEWIPLIPRFYEGKISVSKNIRRTISYELSILRELGSHEIQKAFFTYHVKKGRKNYSSVSKIDFSLYAIIKLSRAGFKSINICQKLGFFTSDYNKIMHQGQQRGLFDKENKLTLFGLQLYNDARKCIEWNKRKIRYELSDYYEIRNVNYLPKQFNGRP